MILDYTSSGILPVRTKTSRVAKSLGCSLIEYVDDNRWVNLVDPGVETISNNEHQQLPQTLLGTPTVSLLATKNFWKKFAAAVGTGWFDPVLQAGFGLLPSGSPLQRVGFSCENLWYGSCVTCKLLLS